MERASSGAWIDPHRYTGGFQGLLRDTGRVITDRVILEWRRSAARAGVINRPQDNVLGLQETPEQDGSSNAAIIRCRSGASTLVAGTSEYIHAARTSANASEPCSVNTSAFRAAGRPNWRRCQAGELQL